MFFVFKLFVVVLILDNFEFLCVWCLGFEFGGDSDNFIVVMDVVFFACRGIVIFVDVIFVIFLVVVIVFFVVLVVVDMKEFVC